MKSKKECLRLCDIASEQYGGFYLDGTPLKDWLSNEDTRKFLDNYDTKIFFSLKLDGKLVLCRMDVKTYKVDTYDYNKLFSNNDI